MSSDDRNHLINAVYYPSWRIYRDLPPSSLQLSYINRVYYAFLRVNEDGTLRFLDEHADKSINVEGKQGCLAALAKLKAESAFPIQNQKHCHDQNQNQCRDRRQAKDELLLPPNYPPPPPGIQTLISIGGGGGSAEFTLLASNPIYRANFAAACRHFVDAHDFDGVDIDWEHPSTSREGKDYVALLAELRRVLPSPAYLITSALPVSAWCLQHIDFGAVASLLDGLGLMGYDLSGPWMDVSGHHAQLFSYPRPLPGTSLSSCHDGVEYLLSKGFPSEKIVLGIPAYARSFTGAQGPGQSFSGTEEMEYGDLPREWIRNASIDTTNCTASYVDYGRDEEEGKGFVSFDVPDTVRLKAEYVKRMHLGGLFYWTGVGDIREGHESLVRTGWVALNGKG